MHKAKMPRVLSTLFFSSLGLGGLYVNSFFAIKPYMLVSALILIYIIFKNRWTLKEISFGNFIIFEYSYMFYLLMIIISLAYSIYPMKTLKYCIGVVILILIFLTLRYFFTKMIDLSNLNKSLADAGLIVAILNLLYYFQGLITQNFNFQGNNIQSYGLLIDRNYPRLTGIATDDPNLSAMYLSIFFLFSFLTKDRKLTSILLFVSILLTFSRGAYLALIGSFIIYSIMRIRILIKTPKINIFKKTLYGIFLVICAFFIANSIFKINSREIIVNRFVDLSNDHGSGRTQIWRNTLITVKENPILGIGGNSSQMNNINKFNDSHYIHNTFLEILLELGIVGLFIFISMLFLSIRQAFRLTKYRINYPFLLICSITIQMLFLSLMLNEVFMICLLIIVTYSYFTFIKSPKNNYLIDTIN